MNRNSKSYLNWVIALFGAMALSLCLIMLRHYLSETSMTGCSAGSSCDTVLSSKWSMLFGVIPVSVIAACLYTILIICCIYHQFTKDSEIIDLIKKIEITASGAIIGSALWFTIVQIFIIKEFCPYCISTHGIGLLISTILLVRKHEIKCRKSLFIIGLILSFIMAGIQLLSNEKDASIEGFINEELPIPDPKTSPIIGNDNAEKIITLMFDYQCSHCQKIHQMVRETIHKFDEKIAFILCPTPLSPKCNHYLPMTDRDLFEGSCDLAILALAIWETDHNAFYRFDSWLFEEEDSTKGWYPRSVSDARQEAASLIGEDRLENALSSDWIRDYMSNCFELFGRTTNSNSGGIPRMIFENKWLIPDANNVDEMVTLLNKSFHLSDNN